MCSVRFRTVCFRGSNISQNQQRLVVVVTATPGHTYSPTSPRPHLASGEQRTNTIRLTLLYLQGNRNSSSKSCTLSWKREIKLLRNNRKKSGAGRTRRLIAKLPHQSQVLLNHCAAVILTKRSQRKRDCNARCSNLSGLAIYRGFDRNQLLLLSFVYITLYFRKLGCYVTDRSQPLPLILTIDVFSTQSG